MNKRFQIPLLIAFAVFAILSLHQAWGEKQKKLAEKQQAVQTAQANPDKPQDVPVPTSAKNAPVVPQQAIPGVAAVSASSAAAQIEVKTDMVEAKISTEGGSLVHLEVLKQRSEEVPDDSSKHFVLLENNDKVTYLAQSGLIGAGLPNHKTLFSASATSYELKEGEDSLQVRLLAPAANGIQVAKIYTFHRGSYLIDVDYEIKNGSKAAFAADAYFQLLRNHVEVKSSTPFGLGGASVFTGPAFYTEQGKYHKVEYEAIDKDKAKLPPKSDNGWVAMVQHYFVSAWLPQGNVQREFYAKSLGNKFYASGVILPLSVAAGETAKLDVPLFVGPQDRDQLTKAAPGLDLVVDYGWLTIVASPLFWVLNKLNSFIGNWGWSIIALTILLKLAFFPLSAASYRSMASMRKLAPQMQKLKEVYKDDKQRLNLEMMDLYKREKINPLGGCLPVVIQIPVFLALYWALLGSVEMRNAPWLGWIVDLSVKDPYYVLPLLMGATMFAQQRLSPQAPDPVQQKMMMFMPIIFTGMFLFFPSGLVLYWTVSNIISIAQQWVITRSVEAGASK